LKVQKKEISNILVEIKEVQGETETVMKAIKKLDVEVEELVF
jgi:hypothetical protein